MTVSANQHFIYQELVSGLVEADGGPTNNITRNSEISKANKDYK